MLRLLKLLVFLSLIEYPAFATANLVDRFCKSVGTPTLDPGEIQNFTLRDIPMADTDYQLERSAADPDQWIARVNLKFNFYQGNENGVIPVWGWSDNWKTYDKEMRDRVRSCIDFINPYLKMHRTTGESLRLELYDPAIHKKRAPPTHNIKVYDYSFRETSQQWQRDSECSVILHEIFHLFGLVDEYTEHDGYYVNASGRIVDNAEEGTRFRSQYSCRAKPRVTDESIMATQNNAIAAAKSGQVLLKPAQFNQITRPTCAKLNRMYLTCAEFAYQTRVDACEDVPTYCKSDGDIYWLEDEFPDERNTIKKAIFDEDSYSIISKALPKVLETATDKRLALRLQQELARGLNPQLQTIGAVYLADENETFMNRTSVLAKTIEALGDQRGILQAIQKEEFQRLMSADFDLNETSQLFYKRNCFPRLDADIKKFVENRKALEVDFSNLSMTENAKRIFAVGRRFFLAAEKQRLFMESCRAPKEHEELIRKKTQKFVTDSIRELANRIVRGVDSRDDDWKFMDEVLRWANDPNKVPGTQPVSRAGLYRPRGMMSLCASPECAKSVGALNYTNQLKLVDGRVELGSLSDPYVKVRVIDLGKDKNSFSPRIGAEGWIRVGAIERN